jgi:hypothetical protein
MDQSKWQSVRRFWNYAALLCVVAKACRQRGSWIRVGLAVSTDPVALCSCIQVNMAVGINACSSKWPRLKSRLQTTLSSGSVAVFLAVTPCSLVEVYRLCKDACRVRHQDGKQKEKTFRDTLQLVKGDFPNKERSSTYSTCVIVCC